METVSESGELVGSLIRREREIRHQSLRECAAALGVSHSTLSRIERGTQSVTLGAVDEVLSAMGLRLHVELEPAWEKVDRAISAAASAPTAERIRQWKVDFTAFLTRLDGIPYLLDGLTAAAAQGAPVPVTAFQIAVPRDDDTLDRVTFALIDMGARRWCERWKEWGMSSPDPRDRDDPLRWKCGHGEIRMRLIEEFAPTIWVHFEELPLPVGPLMSLRQGWEAEPRTPLTAAKLAVVPLDEIEVVDKQARRILDRMRQTAAKSRPRAA